MGIMGLWSSAGKDEGSQAGCLMYSPGNLTMKIINIAYERLYKPPKKKEVYHARWSPQALAPFSLRWSLATRFWSVSAWKRKRCKEITLQVRRKTAGKPGLFHHISPRFLTKLVCLRRGNSCRLNSFQSTLDPSDVLKKIGIVITIFTISYYVIATLWSMSMKRMLSDVCKWWLFERRTPLAVGQPCDIWWHL